MNGKKPGQAAAMAAPQPINATRPARPSLNFFLPSFFAGMPSLEFFRRDSPDTRAAMAFARLLA